MRNSVIWEPKNGIRPETLRMAGVDSPPEAGEGSRGAGINSHTQLPNLPSFILPPSTRISQDIKVPSIHTKSSIRKIKWTDYTDLAATMCAQAWKFMGKQRFKKISVRDNTKRLLEE